MSSTTARLHARSVYVKSAARETNTRTRAAQGALDFDAINQRATRTLDLYRTLVDEHRERTRVDHVRNHARRGIDRERMVRMLYTRAGCVCAVCRASEVIEP